MKTKQNKAALDNPLPAPSRVWKVAKNLNQKRRGAPSSGSQAFVVRLKMEETLFRALLGVGLLGWIRPLVDRASDDQLGELRGTMPNHSTRTTFLVVSLILMLGSLTGLIGMFFDPKSFRWVYLAAVVGMLAATWILPVATNKPKRDIALAEFSRVVDGAILGVAFSGLVTR